MKVEIDKKAQKDFKRINSSDHQLIKKALVSLQNYPDISNIKQLSNFEPGYRLQVGNYRILFDVKEDLIVIYRIRHRKDVYEK
ncbi:MAG: type II toxin-antitoxin system RelE/ParE family toxin [Campylobacterota bacterium]|nr:type II toxin-antitoxin system RelE/ParE family toxin [Campylobacterota bacterium]